jgi:hypothetical protein
MTGELRAVMRKRGSLLAVHVVAQLTRQAIKRPGAFIHPCQPSLTV